MKKLSIQLKLFLWFSVLVISILLMFWLLNTTTLERYYLNYKEKSLIKTYSSIYNAYQNSMSSDKTAYEFEEIETNQNIDIVIKDREKFTVYSTSKDFSNNIYLIANYTFLTGTNYVQERLSGDSKYFTDTIRDKKTNSDFVALIGKLPNEYLIFIRTPMESIKESVIVTNRFLITIGIFSLIFSSLLAFIISKSFTKPITKLNEIAKNISELDFSKPYEITTYDEIGMLGKSINTLSKSLENKINELNEVNAELEKDIEQTSRISEMRSQFVSDVSHELKTPIALIQGYAEGLIDGIATTPEDQKYYLEVILDEANKMSTLTHDLLDLSNLEYGNNDLNITTFDICELISNTLKKNELLFNEQNLTIEFIHELNTINVVGDSFRIEQVITNYLNNAIKNVDENKILKVTITTNDNTNKTRIGVYNSGKHITNENLSRIWNKFYKVDASRTREQNGSGIGLALVKAIMEKHNCKYGVLNSENGVEFYFELNNAEK